MNVSEFSKHILFGPKLENKLLPITLIDNYKNNERSEYDPIDSPCREKRISMSSEQVKFPKKSSFHLDEKRGLALHFFANHELLAIEIMASFLLRFQHIEERIKKIIVSTIKDEQKHLSLYIKRMAELGVEFGDFPLNDFFWRKFVEIEDPHQYFALMSLTFESANLDFAHHYKKCFEDVDDFQTAKIMETVLNDEIGHVSVGYHFLKTHVPNHKDIWTYYTELLPEQMSPARAKGPFFYKEGREMAGIDSEFIRQLLEYKDTFKITKRKEWNRPTSLI